MTDSSTLAIRRLTLTEFRSYSGLRLETGARLVALVAPAVANRGVITARLGQVALASGNQFTVDLYGDQKINLALDQPTTKRVLGHDGQPVTAADVGGGGADPGGTDGAGGTPVSGNSASGSSSYWSSMRRRRASTQTARRSRAPVSADG